MRGPIGCDIRPFDMGPFGHGFDQFGCGGHRGHGHHYGPPGIDHCPFGRGRHGPGFFRPGPPGCHFEHRGPFLGHGPRRGKDSEDCSPESCSFGGCGFGRGPNQTQEGERGPHGRSCADFEHGPRFGGSGRLHSPEGRGPCHGPMNQNGEGRPHGRHGPCHRGSRPNDGGERSHGRHGPCHRGPGPNDADERPHGHHGPCHRGPGPNAGQERHHEHHGPCHGSPGKGNHCERRDHSGERGPGGPYGHHGPHFGPHFGPHRRPFGPWNRQGPYNRFVDDRRPNTDEESGNETECRGRKNNPFCRKNKDQNRDETVLVQRIVVETAPRCYSV